MAVLCTFEGNKQVQLRRGTTAENDAFTGAEGEITYDAQQHRLRTHDGITVGGFAHALLSANIFTGNQSVAGNILLNTDGSSSFGANTLQISSAGTLLLPNGTDASPSLAFVSDPNTGLYRFGADQLGISAGGFTKGVFDSSGLWLGLSEISWSFGFGSAKDTFLFPDGPGNLGLRTDTTFSGSQFHLYNNYVDSLNWERLNLEWNGNAAFLSMEQQGSGLFRNLALGSEGASTVSLRTNATNWYTLSTTGSLVGTKNNIDATPTDNLQLLNSTDAIVGFQQYSPALRFTGQGWKTNATAASQPVDWRIYNQPVQGAGNPTSNLLFDFSVNGAAFSTRLTLSSGGVLSFVDGARQIFNPNATNAGINIGGVVGDPSTLVNGDLWYDSSTNELKGRVNGFTVVIAPAFPEPPFSDATAIIKGSSDVSKLLRFEVDGFTAFTTRVLTPQDSDYIIAGINIAQSFTELQTLSANGIGSAPTDRAKFSNTTAAAAGAQQYSPALRFTGQGWKTNATAASQPVDWRIYNQPVQGSLNALSNLLFDHSVNSGAFVTQMTLTQSGALSTAAAITAGGEIQGTNVRASSTGNIYWLTRSVMASPSDGVIRFTDSSSISFGRLQLGGTSSSYPAIKRNGAGIDLRLADDSLFANLGVRNITQATAALLSVSSGTNQRAGNAVLVAGTVTVSNTTVTANTIVMLTRKTSGGTIGTAITYTVSAGASFTITSDSVLDTSTFSYFLIEVP